MRALLTAVSCLALVVAAHADEVSGRVVSADGSGAGEIVVGSAWHFVGDAFMPYSGTTTGDDGSFTVDVNFYGKPGAIMAMDAQCEMGGLVIVDPESDGPIVITLGPLVEFTGDFYCEWAESRPDRTIVSLGPPGVQIRLASCTSDEAEFRFMLPPGEYDATCYGTDVIRVTRHITLKAGQKRLDLGTINLEPTIIARHYGKVPPTLRVTDARGLPADVGLEDWRGKYTLLEFWGYW